MLFYERAVALNRERHQKLRLEPTAHHFAFAAKTNAVPLASTELPEAARDYPIVFVGAEGGPFSLAALVGLRDKENLFVDQAGQWDAQCYVPAFARRYPFVLAETEGASTLTVCVDEAYAGLNAAERGEALFSEDGKESPYLQRVLQFLRAFHEDMLRTRAFAGRLHELGLLAPKVITIERGRGAGERQHLQGLWIVDEEKLRVIDDARIVEVFRNGYMGWVYAHLLSLGNVRRLAARFDRQTGAAA